MKKREAATVPTPQGSLERNQRKSPWAATLVMATLLSMGACQSAFASQAYGSLNNFDCVNDTGSETHGFEIELDYGRTTDITYTYDYNHYGTPKITEDVSDPAHPRVFVRYESKKKPDGSWAAYTAIPSGPISATQGHQFTDPTVNFGGEHFGLGFMGNPVAVKYHWLLDDGAGNLIPGPPVNISTPSYTYVAANGNKAANVVAVVAPPPPPAPPVFQFGDASWVKEIKTTTHNPNKVHLNDLVGDDPGKPQPWANGEPAEVEMEWRVLQTEFAAAKGGKNGELAGAPEDLPGGDEMITRRYEFYKYVGPIDAETGEAMGDEVGPDGIHGRGTVTYADHYDPTAGEWVTITVDMSKVVVVGDFFGTQMAGFDIAPELGLIDHIQECDANVELAARKVVIPGGSPFLAALKSGTLPPGIAFDKVTGILSGTPTTPGVYTFTIAASDTSGKFVSQAYTMTVAGEANALYSIATSSYPVDAGVTSGDGSFPLDTVITLQATPAPGYRFINWTEDAVEVSNLRNYTLTVNGGHNLVANFAKTFSIDATGLPAIGGSVNGAGVYVEGAMGRVKAYPTAGYHFVNWTEGGVEVSTLPSYSFVVDANRSFVANFSNTYTVNATVSAAGGGTVAGGGTFLAGTSVRIKAIPAAGYDFDRWTDNGVTVGTSRNYTFNIAANRNLVANFVHTSIITTSATPSAGGLVNGAGTYKVGSTTRVNAYPSAGYAFANWTENGTVVATSTVYSFTVSTNRTLVAHFVKTYAITTTAAPVAGGTVAGAGTFKDGATIHVKAVPNAGYKFVNWTEGGVAVSTDWRYSFVVSGARNLTAHFAVK